MNPLGYAAGKKQLQFVDRIICQKEYDREKCVFFKDLCSPKKSAKSTFKFNKKTVLFSPPISHLLSPCNTCVVASLCICSLSPHISWNCTRISLKVSVITAMNTFLTSQATKKIIVVKYRAAFQCCTESPALEFKKSHA